MPELKLNEIAERIYVHLKRFENDPEINTVDPEYETRPYFSVSCWPGEKWVEVRYINYQHASNLTKKDALIYLEWLDAGNVGLHHKALGEYLEDDTTR